MFRLGGIYMEQYTGNSLKSREAAENKPEEKKVEKVVKGTAKVKKKSELYKIASSIVCDEVTSVKEYIIYDVIIPAIRDTISDVIIGSVNLLFHGDAKAGRKGYGTNASKVSYRSFYNDKRDRDRDRDRDRSVIVSYDDIALTSKADAEEVLDRMDEMIDQYGVATVADLFEMVGESGNGYTDRNYGWTSLRTASIFRDRHGDYRFKLPRACPIK